MAGLLLTFGQVQTGTIEYEEVMKFEIKLEGEMAAMARDFPKERRGNKVLYFNEVSSLYTKSELQPERDMSGFEGGGGRMMRMSMSAPHNIVFTDLKKKEVLQQQEFMTRMFLITSELPNTQWKITGRQKMILEYPCMEARSVDTAGIVTVVWFTPSIPVQSGPSRFSNLPGLVLEANVNDSSMVLTAKSISTEAPEKALLKKPKEGKKVSQEEFEQIVADKMEEMGVQGGGPGRHGGGGGVHVIRIHQ